MIPLAMVEAGEKVRMMKLGGPEAARRHLADLGFIPGALIQVVSQRDGDVIIKLGDTRLALTKPMAARILVE